MRATAGIILILISGQLEARIYQWVNTNTGNTQLSGKPPSWYRTTESGPRVIVFENNKLVDDTAVGVDEATRLKLRREAFEAAKERDEGLSNQEAIAELEEQIKALIESPAMGEYLKSAKTEEDKTLPELIAEEPILRERAEVQRETPDERVERLKALITRWDERRTEEARNVLEAENEGSATDQSTATQNTDNADVQESADTDKTR